MRWPQMPGPNDRSDVTEGSLDAGPWPEYHPPAVASYSEPEPPADITELTSTELSKPARRSLPSMSPLTGRLLMEFIIRPLMVGVSLLFAISYVIGGDSAAQASRSMMETFGYMVGVFIGSLTGHY